jgi:hypothetical protein
MSLILIAEDDEAMRSFISMALKKAGHQVIACEDGAVAYAELEADDDKKIELLLAGTANAKGPPVGSVFVFLDAVGVALTSTRQWVVCRHVFARCEGSLPEQCSCHHFTGLSTGGSGLAPR